MSYLSLTTCCLSGFAAAVIVCAAAPARAQNLLVNSGFEAPANALVEDAEAFGWTFEFNTKRVAFAHIGNTTPGGTKAIWGRTFEVSGGGVFQDVSITGGTPYDLTAQIYFEEFYKDTAAVITLELIWMTDSTPVGTAARTEILPSSMPAFGAWGPRNVNGIAPVGANKVRVALGWENGSSVVGAQSVFFDDPVLIGEGSPPTGSVWAANASGNWHLNGSWKNGVIPNAAGAEAQFLGDITAPRTVFADIATTAGTLRFDNANTYVIAGAGSLTIQVNSGSGSIAVVSGSQKINLPLFFASNTNIAVSPGATLTIADPMTIRANQTVTKTGNLVIQAPLTLEAGASLVTGLGPTALFGAPTLGAGAKIDVKNTTLVVDYRGQGSAANAIKAQLTSGYNGGSWNGSGIGTTAPLTLNGKPAGLGWKDDPANQQVIIRFTTLGDSDLDGDTDGADIATWAVNFSGSLTPGTGTRIWATADWDYDGDTDGADAALWAQSFTGSLAGLGPVVVVDSPISAEVAAILEGLGVTVVPEPASATLVGALAAWSLKRPRSRCARRSRVTRGR